MADIFGMIPGLYYCAEARFSRHGHRLHSRTFAQMITTLIDILLAANYIRIDFYDAHRDSARTRHVAVMRRNFKEY